MSRGGWTFLALAVGFALVFVALLFVGGGP